MYTLNCDYCETELESGDGAPDSRRKAHVYCSKCAFNMDRVDQAVRDETEKRAYMVHEDLETFRKRKILEFMPQQTLPQDSSPVVESGQTNPINNDQRSVNSNRGRRISA